MYLMREIAARIPFQMTDPEGISYDNSHWSGTLKPFPNYEIWDEKIVIDDDIWGRVEIGQEEGDGVFLELVAHPLMRRLHSIAQLTLPPFMETMPGIYSTSGDHGFTRWHHAWGSLAFVRKKGTELGIEPRTLRRLELTALLSDATQWLGSHLGDFMFEGFGGSESEHDKVQKQVFEKVRLAEVLERHGFSLDEVLLSSLPDGFGWVEESSPALCTDRVDYGARQIAKHLLLTSDVEQAIRPEAFVVDPATGELLMTGERLARAFTKAFLILPTEHWGEPVHRLQLHLLQEAAKHLFVHQEPMMFDIFRSAYVNPQDFMHSIDGDITTRFGISNAFIWAIKDISAEIGRQKRLINQTVRQSELQQYLLDDTATELPDPLVSKNSIHRKRHSLLPPNLEIIEVEDVSEIPDFKNNPLTVDFELPSLKRRWIRPRYIADDGTIKDIAEEDPAIMSLLLHQEQLLNKKYVARVLVNSDYKKILENGLRENHDHWPELMASPRMPDDIFRANFERAADFGVPHRMAQILWAR